MTKIIWCGG